MKLSYTAKSLIAYIIILVAYITLLIVLPNWLLATVLAGVAGWAIGSKFPDAVKFLFDLMGIVDEENTAKEEV